MNRHYDRDELFRLLGAFCQGTLDGEKSQRLAGTLREYPPARRDYLEYMDLHAALQWEIAGRAEIVEIRQCFRMELQCFRTELQPRSLKLPRPAVRRFPRLFSGKARFAVAMALLVLAGAALFAVGRMAGWASRDHNGEVASTPAKDQVPASADATTAGTPSLQVLPVPPPPSYVARLTRLARCSWTDPAHSHQAGDRIGAGQYLELESGVVEMEFAVGVRAVVQGPASLDLVSDRKVDLHSGKLTAEILRPEARGFLVQTPKGNVVDLGTEFGVEVSPAQDVEVHVFKGEVVVERSADGTASKGKHVFRNQGLRMESGTAGPLLVEDAGDTFIRTINDADRDRHVVAYWRFEDHPVGEVVADTSGNTKPVRGTVDSSFNGNDLFTYSASTRPRFSGDVPQDGNGSAALLASGAPNRGCLDNTMPPVEGSPTRDLCTRSRFSHAAPIDIEKARLAQWTIEASVKAKVIKVGTQTFVGRDGGQGAVMAFRIDPQDHFEIFFRDKHHSHRAVSNERVRANQWYHLAAVSDGTYLRLYDDELDGRGYQLCRTSYLYPEKGSTVLDPTNPNAQWSVGRGRLNRVTCEWFQGWIDEVRICNVALEPNEFLFAPHSENQKGAERAAGEFASASAAVKRDHETRTSGVLQHGVLTK